jgi:protein-disulfide isomerase
MELKMKISFLLAALVIYSCSPNVNTTNKNVLFVTPTAGAPNEVVAKIGNELIYDKEFNEGIEVELFELEEKIFNLKMDRFKVLMLEKFMKLNPQKVGLTNDEFFEKYIAKNIEPTKSDIAEFMKSRGIAQDQLNPELLPKIKIFLKENLKKKALEKWLDQESLKYKVEVYFKKPQRPFFDVKVGDSPFMGGKDAKVTIIAYSDYQCPFSKKGSEIIKELGDAYGDKVKIVHKDFPLPFHSKAKVLAEGALCANEQNNKNFWKFYYKIFQDQTIGSEEQLKNISKEIGLDDDKFSKCLGSRKYSTRIDDEVNEAIKLGVKSTPTFFINGKIINGAHNIELFKTLIDEELTQNKKTI